MRRPNQSFVWSSQIICMGQSKHLYDPVKRTWARYEFGHHGHDIDIGSIDTDDHFVGAFLDGKLTTTTFVLNTTIIHTFRYVHREVTRNNENNENNKYENQSNGKMSMGQIFGWPSQMVSWARVKYLYEPVKCKISASQIFV